jgi:hypothetical protein
MPQSVFSACLPSMLDGLAEDHNLMSIYGVKLAPCDTQIRTRLEANSRLTLLSWVLT